MLENKLKKLGFDKNERLIYLALFELGRCRAREIIKHTGLVRNSVYTTLEDLVHRGLVKKYWCAALPSLLQQTRRVY